MITERFHAFSWPERQFPESGFPVDGESAYLVTPERIERGQRRDTWRQNSIYFAYRERYDGSEFNAQAVARPYEVVTASMLFSTVPEIERGPLLAHLLAEKAIIEIGKIRQIPGLRHTVDLTPKGAAVVYGFANFMKSYVVGPAEPPEAPVALGMVRRIQPGDFSAPSVYDGKAMHEFPKIVRADLVEDFTAYRKEGRLIDAGKLLPDGTLDLTPAVRRALAELCITANDSTTEGLERIVDLLAAVPEKPEATKAKKEAAS
ncbi:MAG: hypothetical protein RBT62_11430 [Spirochaetia bacterium]|jgi:hypothetical protein|nr:hypothetical protein [Spirochaetia bacterium]